MSRIIVLTSYIHAYHYGSTIFIPENHENQQGVPEIRIASQKFQILSVMGEKKQKWPFQYFLRGAEGFVPELTEATFGRIAHARKTLGSAVLMHERHEADETSPKFPEENIASAKLQAK